MPADNKVEGYQSLFMYFVARNRLARWFGERFYRNETYRMLSRLDDDDRRSLLGGLKPILDIGDDFANTFKPYTPRDSLARDWLQPLRGLGNIVKGVIYLIVVPVLFIVNAVRYLFISGSLTNLAWNQSRNASRSTFWMLDGISSLIQGVVQLATTPFTWLIKMPLRGLLTVNEGALEKKTTQKTRTHRGQSYHSLDGMRRADSKKKADLVNRFTDLANSTSHGRFFVYTQPPANDRSYGYFSLDFDGTGTDKTGQETFDEVENCGGMQTFLSRLPQSDKIANELKASGFGVREDYLQFIRVALDNDKKVMINTRNYKEYVTAMLKHGGLEEQYLGKLTILDRCCLKTASKSSSLTPNLINDIKKEGVVAIDDNEEDGWDIAQIAGDKGLAICCAPGKFNFQALIKRFFPENHTPSIGPRG